MTSDLKRKSTWNLICLVLLMSVAVLCVIYFEHPDNGSIHTYVIAAQSMSSSVTQGLATHSDDGGTQAVQQKPGEVREGSFSCDQVTAQTALELVHAGWTFIMPEPKSPQAAWGNGDGRTTWWVGYWINAKDNSRSLTQPTKAANGNWVGDGRGGPIWRRGGTPFAPTKIEWLCSKYGGIPPN